MTTLRAEPASRARAEDAPGHCILLIEDESAISSLIARALSAAGYAVDRVETGMDGLRHAASGAYDLVLLDLVMPDVDGRVVLQQLLDIHPDQAVVVLSCVSDVTAKVECLDLGARDYLTKPFALDELTARVRVQMRSNARMHAESITNGDLTLDLWRLQADNGHGRIPLTRLEFLLLRELMEHAGESVPKGELLSSVWGYDFDPGSNVVDVCVWRLRAKLGYELIKTVRGEGYQLASG
jgi:two-component system, OmpR family, response regulator